jgi:gas vesicle protein
MSKMNVPGTIATFVLGMGVGACAALLLAPSTGRKLRDDITTGVSDGVDQVNAARKGIKRRAEKVIAHAKNDVADTIDAGRNAYSHAKKE